MQSTYPSWRYHRSGKPFLVSDPDHEPQGPDWDDKPWPQPKPQPKLAECCQKLKDKFDAAWDAQQKQFKADWEAKVQECAALSAELEALKTSSEPARTKKK